MGEMEQAIPRALHPAEKSLGNPRFGARRKADPSRLERCFVRFGALVVTAVLVRCADPKMAAIASSGPLDFGVLEAVAREHGSQVWIEQTTIRPLPVASQIQCDWSTVPPTPHFVEPSHSEVELFQPTDHLGLDPVSWTPT